jgi:hypothetical protein
MVCATEQTFNMLLSSYRKIRTLICSRSLSVLLVFSKTTFLTVRKQVRKLVLSVVKMVWFMLKAASRAVTADLQSADRR